MDNIKLIGELCSIIESMDAIIELQSYELAQLCVLQHEDEIVAIRNAYCKSIGKL